MYNLLTNFFTLVVGLQVPFRSTDVKIAEVAVIRSESAVAIALACVVWLDHSRHRLVLFSRLLSPYPDSACDASVFRSYGGCFELISLTRLAIEAC
jgi:hypothetical protein